MKIKKDWWKDFFNEIYLITDARSVCDNALTSQEVSLIEKILDLDKSDNILDLCGGYGRHSLELARRGYGNLTVLDSSNYLIKLGKRLAKNEALDIKFLRKDARFSGLQNNHYSTILVMANSFGYFLDERKNLKILKEIYRLLKIGGKLLLDLSDPDYVRKNLKPISWHQANPDVLVCRKREINADVVKIREIVISKTKGLLRDGLYAERIYNKNKITLFLKNIGFKNLLVKKNIPLHKSRKDSRKDYGLLTSRMLVTAAKP